MRIVFIGAVKFSRLVLERLIALDHQIVGVVTLESSSFNADHVDLAPIATASNIPWTYAPDVNSPSTMRWIKDCAPDVIFCFGWSRLIKRPLLDLPRLGVIGYHPTLLPANRGRHPLIWALALGLNETGSTFFWMEEGADTGDILSQERVAIGVTDDASSLYRKIVACALAQIEAFVPSVAFGTYTRTPQDHRLATTWRKRGRADGQIDWRMQSTSIHNLIRALARPYPGAHFVYQGHDVKVWQSEVVAGTLVNLEPGRVVDVDIRGPVIKCGEAAIRLLETEPAFAPRSGEYL